MTAHREQVVGLSARIENQNIDLYRQELEESNFSRGCSPGLF